MESLEGGAEQGEAGGGGGGDGEGVEGGDGGGGGNRKANRLLSLTNYKGTFFLLFFIRSLIHIPITYHPPATFAILPMISITRLDEGGFTGDDL